MRLILPFIMGATSIAYGAADLVQQFPLGTRAFGNGEGLTAVANSMNMGGEFIYCQTAGALATGVPVGLISNTHTVAALANTANLGQAVGICASNFTATNLFGWVQIAGVAPVVNNGTFAAGAAVFIQAAGVLSTTVAAGKEILGIWSIVAAAATFTKVCQTTNGGKTLKVPDTNGLFAGLAVSGTGIAASSTISDIQPGDQTILLNNAMTASGKLITITFTYTNLGGVYMNHPMAQGQIT